MIEYENENKEPEEKPKEKRGKGRPRRTTAFKRKPMSPARIAAAKAKVRDEAGRLLGKRQLLLKIDYNPDEQRFTLDSLSGNGKIKESEPYSGLPGLKNRIDKLLHRWRSELT